MKHATTTAIIAALALSGCATSGQDVAAAYVPASAYAGMSCTDMQAEAELINQRVADLTASQNQEAAQDQTAMNVGLILFWPALFFVEGDGETAANLADAKGSRDALMSAASARGCRVSR